MKDALVSSGNDVEFTEYEYGHLGLILPPESGITDNMFASIMNVTNEAELVPAPAGHLEEAKEEAKE